MDRPTVFITGCSSGIGRATALLFQKQGWRVAATMRQPTDGKDLAALSGIKVYRLDVTKQAEIARAASEVLMDFGAIDVLVNNAGYGLMGPFEAATESQIRRQIDTNLLGMIRVTRSVLPSMRQRKHGVIVNLSSNAGRMAFPFYSFYNATKFAVEGLSEALYHELFPLDIRVKVIEPGPIDTDFFGRSAVYAQDDKLPAYSPFVRHVYTRMRQSNSIFRSSPDAVAHRIYSAATDGSTRLRYPAGKIAPFMLWLHAILPQRLILPMIRAVTMRKE